MSMARRTSGTFGPIVDWYALTPEERRLFLQNLNEPPQFKLRVPGAAHGARRRRS